MMTDGQRVLSFWQKFAGGRIQQGVKKMARVASSLPSVPFGKPKEFFRWLGRIGGFEKARRVLSLFAPASQQQYFDPLMEWAEQNLEDGVKQAEILGHPCFVG